MQPELTLATLESRFGWMHDNPTWEPERTFIYAMWTEIERLRCAYEQERQDCINLTEKVIPSLRAEIERLRSENECLWGLCRNVYGSDRFIREALGGMR